MRAGRALCAVAVASALAAPAAAQNTFKTANWSGGTYFQGDKFSGCYVRRTYADGTKVEFQMTPRLEMYMGASKPGWSFTAGQKFELSFEMDGGFRKTYSGAADSNQRDTIWFTIGNDPDLRRALAGNGTLTWVDPKGLRFPFAMENADNALRKLLACTALFGVD
jgi:hypothetical protein